LLTPEVYDYYSGAPGATGQWIVACDGADGVRDLPTGITADLAHTMALAGARTITDVAGVTAPTTAHSLDT
jgi:hypothetical protein